MLHSNFHIHSTFCDGKNTLEEMVQAAIDAGLTDIGFTSHQPLPYPNDFAMRETDAAAYIEEVKRLQAAYAGQIAISLGMEIDWFIAQADIGQPAKECLPELDFFIGSIHTVGQMQDGVMADIDYTEDIFRRGIQDCYGGDATQFVKAYYHAMGTMAEKLAPDIIGHIDLIKKNNPDNRIFDDTADWYQEAVCTCLDRIAQTDCIVEVNTGGMIRYGERCRYPSDFILKEVKKRGIPITVNGDSHSVEAIAYAYDAMEALIRAMGFEQVMLFKKGVWVPEDL